MPLDLPDVSAQFLRLREDILSWDDRREQGLHQLQGVLEGIGPFKSSMTEDLKNGSGAMVLEEGGFIHPAALGWDGRCEAVEWADGVLSGRRVSAVDGSQIYPRKGDGVPIALVRAALVSNRHVDRDGYSVRRVQRLIAPGEFKRRHIYRYSDSYVDARRFQLECELAMGDMDDGEGPVIMDGSLVLTHIGSLRQELREMHLNAMEALIKRSISSSRPLVAYIDRSTSHDLVNLLVRLGELRGVEALTDAFLLRGMLGWGDRSSVFLCDRQEGEGPGTRVRGSEEWKQVAFFYINLSGGEPSRVEFPVRMYNAGLTGELAGTLRALAVVRGGYPDTLKRAHDEAVVRMGEASLFYRMVDQFLSEGGIVNDLSRKDMFKRDVS